MNIRPHRFYSTRFSQESLDTELRETTFDQLAIFKLLLIMITVSLSILAGCCSAVLYILMIRILLFYEEAGSLLAVATAVTVVVWFIETFRINLATAVWEAAAVGSVGILAIIVYSLDPSSALDYDVTLVLLYFVLLFALLIAVISFFSSCLSFQMCQTIYPQRSGYLKTFCSIFIITASVTTAFHGNRYTGDIAENFRFIVNYYSLINIVSGLIFGVLVIAISQKALFLPPRADSISPG